MKLIFSILAILLAFSSIQTPLSEEKTENEIEMVAHSPEVATKRRIVRRAPKIEHVKLDSQLSLPITNKIESYSTSALYLRHRILLI